MNAKIAIFNYDNFNTNSDTTVLKVIIFERDSALWKETDECYVNLSPASDIGAVRRALDALLERLGDCRIAAGPCISGILFRELDKRGFYIFETSVFTPETLDGILGDIEKSDGAPNGAEVPAQPVETETPGVYQMDLIKLQETHPEITSKQALRDFIETTPFYELRLVCAHVPPWLESGPYDITAESVGGSMLAAVRKKQCGGG